MTDDIFDQEKKRKLTEISRRIRSARENAHLSQDKLGELVGVSDKSISAYEQGRSVPPINKLKKLAEATRHPLSFFTAEDPDNAIIATKLSQVAKLLNEIKEILSKMKN